MQLHELKRKTTNKSQKRVGRGGGRGKTSGRGTKGQKARAGHKIWPNIREQLKKLPKLRGRGIAGLRSIQDKPLVVNLSTLEKFFAAGDMVTFATLKERKLIRVRKGKVMPVKILGDGELTKKLIISGCIISGSAKAKVEKAGGSVVVAAPVAKK
jgi:large subunit ribosomal protein L15